MFMSVCKKECEYCESNMRIEIEGDKTMERGRAMVICMRGMIKMGWGGSAAGNIYPCCKRVFL